MRGIDTLGVGPRYPRRYTDVSSVPVRRLPVAETSPEATCEDVPPKAGVLATILPLPLKRAA